MYSCSFICGHHPCILKILCQAMKTKIKRLETQNKDRMKAEPSTVKALSPQGGLLNFRPSGGGEGVFKIL